MDYYEHIQPPFAKAILSGLFAGLIATVVSLLYNVIFRTTADYLPADIINVSTLIFVMNLVFLILGGLYFIFLKVNGGQMIFRIIFLLLTIFAIWKTEAIQRFANQHLNAEFKTLLLGIVIISGISAFLLVPFLYHSKKFEEHVL